MRDMLGNMQILHFANKVLIFFWFVEFKELCCLVVPIINKNARLVGLPCFVSRRPLKLKPKQQLLIFHSLYEMPS